MRGSDRHQDNPTQPGEQTENRASEITCAAMRRLVIRDNLDGIFEIIAMKAEETPLALRWDERGTKCHFREVLSFLGDAFRGPISAYHTKAIWPVSMMSA